MYDIKLDENGDIPITAQRVLGEDLVIQRIEIRFRTFLGEYLLDTAQGLPYLEWTQTFPVPLDQIRDAFANEIATCPGVLSLDSITATFDETAQRVTIDAQATLEADSSLEISAQVGTSTDGEVGRVAVLSNLRGVIL